MSIESLLEAVLPSVFIVAIIVIAGFVTFDAISKTGLWDRLIKKRKDNKTGFTLDKCPIHATNLRDGRDGFCEFCNGYPSIPTRVGKK